MNALSFISLFFIKLTVLQQYPRVRAYLDLTETNLQPRTDGCDWHAYSTSEQLLTY